MANVFKPKRSTTPFSEPTTSDLTDGELAVNLSDKKIYIRNGSNISELGEYNWKDSYYSGSTKLGISTTLNVGIGSTQPKAKLDVEGNTELDDLNVSGVSTFQGDVTIGTGVEATAFFDLSTNHVAIGTDSTSYYLEVAPVGSSGTSLLVNGDLFVTGIVTSANTVEHRILDDIASSFNGSTTQFTLASNGDNFINSEILTPARLMISVGGIVQQPDLSNQKGYNISGGTDRTTDPLKIDFAEAPKSGEVFFGVAYGLTIEKQDAYITYNDSLVNSIVFGV